MQSSTPVVISAEGPGTVSALALTLDAHHLRPLRGAPTPLPIDVLLGLCPRQPRRDDMRAPAALVGHVSSPVGRDEILELEVGDLWSCRPVDGNDAPSCGQS
jgi:hypothetical protein